MNYCLRSMEGLSIEQSSVFLILAVAVLLASAKYFQHLGNSRSSARAPKHRPLWMGPDLIETTEHIRRHVLSLLQQAGHSEVSQHPASDELAQHHAFAMAARNFCGPVDPEGEGPSQRLRRLHPEMVMALVEWDCSVDALHARDAQHLAELLIEGPDTQGLELSKLIGSQQCNILGVSASGSASRACVCIVLGHHWATLTSDRPQLERTGTWPVAAELVPGTRREQLSAVLISEKGTESLPVAAEAFSKDEWSDDRICAYPDALEQMEGVRIQWRREGVLAITVPVP